MRGHNSAHDKYLLCICRQLSCSPESCSGPSALVKGPHCGVPPMRPRNRLTSHEVRELKSLGGAPGPWRQETRTDLRTAGTSHSQKRIGLHCTSVLRANPGVSKICEGVETMAGMVAKEAPRVRRKRGPTPLQAASPGRKPGSQGASASPSQSLGSLVKSGE